MWYGTRDIGVGKKLGHSVESGEANDIENGEGGRNNLFLMMSFSVVSR